MRAGAAGGAATPGLTSTGRTSFRQLVIGIDNGDHVGVLSGLGYTRGCLAVPGPLSDLWDLVNQKDTFAPDFAPRFRGLGAAGTSPEVLCEQAAAGSSLEVTRTGCR